MTDRVEDLSRAFERFPGIGPRQAKRFVYHLLASSESGQATTFRINCALGAPMFNSALSVCDSGAEADCFVTTAQIQLVTIVF